MTNYVNFSKIGNQVNLRTKFIRDAKDYGSARLNLLLSIIDTYKQVKINVFTNDDGTCYMVMIVCYIDKILIKLAKSYNFPRGFPIFWIPGKTINMFGFYPKFDNDDRCVPDDISEFDGLTHIEFFKKWSGFLGQCCFFMNGDVPSWTCCSKNSADKDSKFVQECHRLFAPFVTDMVIYDMIAENRHVCAEIMSKNDQKHGAVVIMETPVITSIGSGCRFVMNGLHYDDGEFVQFMSHKDIVILCNRLMLPCDSAIIIDGSSAGNFMKRLSEKRDFIDNDSFNNLIDSTTNVTIVWGTVTHGEVLGDVLEGIVVNCPTMTKKYKFPKYTVRTMALRDQIKKCGSKGLISPIVYTAYDSYVNYWCVSEAGKRVWLDYLLDCSIVLKRDNRDIMVHDKIATHIMVSDAMDNITVAGDSHENYFSMIKDSVVSTVIIVTGPIGYGKTTFSDKVVDMINVDVDMCEHIDGDVLCGIGNVDKLGKERGDYTMSLVIKTLMKGKIPVLSCGGGILFIGRSTTFMLRKRIRDTLNIEVKIIVAVPNQVHVAYNDFSIVKRCIDRRISTGEWVIPTKFGKNVKGFTAYIFNRSKKNMRFTRELMDVSDVVVYYSGYDQVDVSMITSIIVAPIGMTDIVGHFMQYRLLAFYDDKYYHITVKFDNDRGIKLSMSDFDHMDMLVSDKIFSGDMIYGIVNQKVIKAITVVPTSVECIIVGVGGKSGNHITINAGVHMPMMMRDMCDTTDSDVTLVSKSGESFTYKIINKGVVDFKIVKCFGI